MSAPVPFTCPTIDSIIVDLKNAEQILTDVLDDFNYISLNDLKDRIKEARDEVSSLHGHRSSIEEVRSANEQLRQWGEQQEDRIKELEDELEESKQAA
jgi:predicted RNase H-like nuclease (RuvC/YqgF family)